MFSLKDLNKEQLQAVESCEGPVLVLAGAGSGKTRVITYRIAYLLQEKLAKPWEILAVTFTNKAAREMQDRVLAMVNGGLKDCYLGTFHAFGARFLRRHAEFFNRTTRFTIYDDDDQSRLIRNLVKAQVPEILAKSIIPGLKKFIGRVKNNLHGLDGVALPPGDVNVELFKKLYLDYDKALKQNNAFDFDDLISLPCVLLGKDAELRKQYRDRFRFILIDEFQDTNYPQGELARLLAAPAGNITAVGDDDQSIYGWRGAYLGNILQFEQDFKGVKIFRLEQNYRSTKAILDVAHHIIVKNKNRHPKKLWTDRHSGQKPQIISAFDDREEARIVVEKIVEKVSGDSYNYGDCVILYRTNAQSRNFEDALRKNQIPYTIVGGLRFYERKEIKDFLGYLRLLVNPSDLICLQRVINLPPRGIGPKTLAVLSLVANESGKPVFEIIRNADKIEELPRRTVEKLKQFAVWIEGLAKMAASESLFKVGEKLLGESGLLEYYRKEEADEFKNREDNLSELLNALREYSHASARSGLEDLDDFLQEVALVTDIDRWNKAEKSLTLMTLHAAKGLEFPIVFLTGLEDGLFPLFNSLQDQSEIEEERRLFYVGATRAKELLFLTYARSRMRWGQEVPYQMPSRFIQDIPQDLLEPEESAVGRNQIFHEEKRSFHKRETSFSFSHSKPRIDSVKDEFSLGSRVQHAQFGEGIIIHTEGRGSALRILVNFEQAGEKLLLAEYAKLKILNG
ncbi:MAG: UvrD-helicase domain-containing protein [bacterium]|nr:UvrD-helicase domain-containing protein [bacterium]